IRNFVRMCNAFQRKETNLVKSLLHPISVKMPFYKIGIDIPETKAIETTNTNKIADFIYKDVVCWYGCLQYLLSDRGTQTHFRNSLIDEFLKRFKIDQFNKSLCESLAKLVTNVQDWDLLISSNCISDSKTNTTKITLFYLVYVRDALLSIHPSESEKLSEGTILQCLFELIEVVSQFRAAI
ncbi:25238_t:CDS:2, partial [Gigaspora rosea]